MTPQARKFLAMLTDGAEGHGPRTGDGVACGDWVYVSDGVVRAEGRFLEGAPHGVWRVCDRRSVLRSESDWDRGVPSRRLVTLDADGTLERIDLKRDDRLRHDILILLAHITLAHILLV